MDNSYLQSNESREFNSDYFQEIALILPRFCWFYEIYQQEIRYCYLLFLSYVLHMNT